MSFWKTHAPTWKWVITNLKTIPERKKKVSFITSLIQRQLWKHWTYTVYMKCVPGYGYAVCWTRFWKVCSDWQVSGHQFQNCTRKRVLTKRLLRPRFQDNCRSIGHTLYEVYSSVKGHSLRRDKFWNVCSDWQVSGHQFQNHTRKKALTKRLLRPWFQDNWESIEHKFYQVCFPVKATEQWEMKRMF